jgi:hypothetical protein
MLLSAGVDFVSATPPLETAMVGDMAFSHQVDLQSPCRHRTCLLNDLIAGYVYEQRNQGSRHHPQLQPSGLWSTYVQEDAAQPFTEVNKLLVNTTDE